MRWLSFFILAYVLGGLQLGLGPHMRAWGASPNPLLMGVVFIAINAPRQEALLGCFLLGLLHDLLAADSLGVYSLSYGLFALMAAGSSNTVYRKHPLTHVALTLGGGVLTAIVLIVHGVVPFAHAVRLPIGPTLWSALYSAVLAPIVLFVLSKMSGVFGFRVQRRRL